MATNHTEHYQLNLWEPSDKFLREEVNENTQKLDAALSQKADTSAVTAALAKKADAETVSAALDLKCRFAAGGYVGNGEPTQHITIGFRPKVVLVWVLDWMHYNVSNSNYSAVCGLFVDGVWQEEQLNFILPTDTGFNVRYDGRRQFTNRKGNTFNYIAFA